MGLHAFLETAEVEETSYLPKLDAAIQERLRKEPEFAAAVQLALDRQNTLAARNELLKDLTENERLFVELRQAKAVQTTATAIVKDLESQVREKLKDGEAVGYDVKRYSLEGRKSSHYDTAKMVADGVLTKEQLESYRKPDIEAMQMVNR